MRQQRLKPLVWSVLWGWIAIACSQSTHYYRFTLDSEQTVYFRTLTKIIQAQTDSESAAPSQDLKLRLQLSGTLTVSIIKEAANSRLLAYKVAPASLTLSTNGEKATPSDTRQLNRELEKATLYAEVDSQGRIERIWLHQAMDFSQGVLRTVASLMQAALPTNSTKVWEVKEESPEGVYVAHYEVQKQESTGWRLQKQRLRYTEVQPNLFPFPYEIRPKGALQIDYEPTQRVARKVQGNIELTSVAHGQTIAQVNITFDAHQTKTDTLTEKEREQFIAQYRLVEDKAQTLRITESSVVEQDVVKIAKLELGNETYTSLKQQWNQLSEQADFAEVAVLSRKWRALLVLNPQIVSRTEADLRTIAFNIPKAQVLVSALMHSQLPEAQQALCRLADHFLKRGDSESYRYYVACLALLEPPHPPVLDWLVVKARSASPDTAYPALLALGAVGRGMPAAQQPQARDSAYKTILDKLNTAQSDKDIEVCLLAMGNLGHPDSLPVLEPFLSHENETLRAVATSSLRFIETPAAERLLMRMLRDASREVRLQAIEAFNHRRISQALLPELAQYLREESQKDLRRALIDALWLHRSRVSGVRPLIAQAATGDPDEEIRLYAQGLLQQKE